MDRIFVISDTHFGHENSLKWLDEWGNKLRPFNTIEELNNTIVTNWNNVVKDNDHVYHIGDVVINKKYLDVVKQLKGKKRLVLGNHDIFDNKMYYDVGFQKLFGTRVFPGLQAILTHYPIHPDCIKEGWINICGHLHSNNLLDRRYINVSVEQVNYTPVLLNEILTTRRREL